MNENEKPTIRLEKTSQEFNQSLTEALEGFNDEDVVLSDTEYVIIGVHAKLDMIIDSIKDINNKLDNALNDYKDIKSKVNNQDNKIDTWLATTTRKKL